MIAIMKKLNHHQEVERVNVTRSFQHGDRPPPRGEHMLMTRINNQSRQQMK